MAIAKSTEPVETPRAFQPASTSSISSVPTVAWDILRFFNVDMHELNHGSMEEQLKDIERWAFDGEETLGNGLVKLKHLEIRLGTPQHGETRVGRIHNWVKLEKAIKDLKLRQEAI